MCIVPPGSIFRSILADNRQKLGELVLGREPGRTDERSITLFKSVGLAVQDAVAARCALEHARRLGLGQEIVW